MTRDQKTRLLEAFKEAGRTRTADYSLGVWCTDKGFSMSGYFAPEEKLLAELRKAIDDIDSSEPSEPNNPQE